MDNLVIATLQECGINRAKRLHPACRKARAECDAVLFSNANVKGALGETTTKQIKTSTIRHRRRDRDDLVVPLRLFDQALGKDLRVAGRVAGRLFLLTCDHIELGRCVATVRAILGVAFALLGHRMDQDRAISTRLDGAQNGQQLIHIVAINRADVGKPQLLKQGATNRHAFEHFFGPLSPFLERLGQHADSTLGRSLKVLEGLARIEPTEIAGHRANGWGDGHLIVVQDDDQPCAFVACVVQRLIGHAPRKRPVADDGNSIAHRFGAEIARDSKAHSRRD